MEYDAFFYIDISNLSGDARPALSVLTKYNCYIYHSCMNTKTTVSIKLDREVRDGVQHLARDFGVPMSTLVNASLKNVIREGVLVLSREPKIKESVWKELRQASEDFKKGKNVSPIFESGEEMDAYLKTL